MSRRSSARAAWLAQAASLGGATQHDLRTFWTSCRLCRLVQRLPPPSCARILVMTDSFSTHDTLEVNGERYRIASLAKLGKRFNLGRLPYSMKILLENL